MFEKRDMVIITVGIISTILFFVLTILFRSGVF